MRSLTRREKLLLTFCLVTLFAVVNIVGGQIVIRGLMRAQTSIRELEQEKRDQELWLLDRDYYLQKEDWINEHFSGLASTGKAQGEMLEQMQDQTYERKLELERQTLLEPTSTEYYQEVAVNLRVEGDLMAVQEWLSTLQDITSFQVIKNLELELETRSRETEPQGEANVTVARWFNPDAGPPDAADPSQPEEEMSPETSENTVSPETTPADVTSTPEPVTPTPVQVENPEPDPGP